MQEKQNIREHPGYRARNLDVARIYALNTGLCNIQTRMKKRKDCPLWLLERLDMMILKSNCLIRPLIDHRDELPPSIVETATKSSGSPDKNPRKDIDIFHAPML